MAETPPNSPPGTLLRSPRQRRVAVLLGLHDLGMAAIAIQLALWLRYQTALNAPPLYSQWQAMVLFTAVAGLSFYLLGLHRGIWRFTALSNLVTIVKAVSLTVLLFLPALFLINRLDLFPRSVILIVWPILVLLLSAPRFAFRLWSSGSFATLLTRDEKDRTPVLVAGLGDEADRFIRESQADRNSRYRVVGLIDRDPAQTGRDIRGVSVLGTQADFLDVIGDLTQLGKRPHRIVLSPASFDGDTVRALLAAAGQEGIPVARLPQATELSQQGLDHGVGRSLSAHLQPVDVTDLLGRPQKALDRAAMKGLVSGRRVLVTGAGGTIGSELARQIAALEPAEIALLDNSEYALYLIDLELSELWPAVARRSLLCDVRSVDAVERAFGAMAPDIVFHAAALKHVPLVEANPSEGVLTNVGGTRIVADACVDHHVGTMVLISTDKAVNPTSVMGATKRIAELWCQGRELARGTTRFVTVRFGNVLGSTGSVVPLFQRQIARGGPVTVTDPKVTRYFMTTREAVELVLQAAALPAEASADGGHIFVLDMGTPVLIADLAYEMIRLAGLRPEIDIDIVYTGLRPGEKLHEALFHEGEPLVPTPAEGVLLARPRVVPLSLLEPAIDGLLAAAQSRDADTLERALRTLVPEFAGDIAPDSAPQRVSAHS